MKPLIPRILIGMFLASTLAVASASTEKYITSNDLQSFDAQAKDVTAGMTAGGRFQFVSESKRARVAELLELIRSILVKYPAVDAIGDRDKLLVFNSQEEINAILTKGDGERLICTKEAVVGTHRVTKVCVTQAQKEQQQEVARRALQSNTGNQTGGN